MHDGTSISPDYHPLENLHPEKHPTPSISYNILDLLTKITLHTCLQIHPIPLQSFPLHFLNFNTASVLQQQTPIKHQLFFTRAHRFDITCSRIASADGRCRSSFAYEQFSPSEAHSTQAHSTQAHREIIHQFPTPYPVRYLTSVLTAINFH